MTVFVMDRVEESVRGELTRWLLELKPGVFVGKINARVRDLLWERICADRIETGAILVFQAANEQGYEMKLYGNPKRKVIDCDGLQLIEVRREPEEATKKESGESDSFPDF